MRLQSPANLVFSSGPSNWMTLAYFHQLRARRALSIFKDVPLRTRRALSLYNVYGDNALPVLSGVSLNRDSGLLDLN